MIRQWNTFIKTYQSLVLHSNIMYLNSFSKVKKCQDEISKVLAFAHTRKPFEVQSWGVN